MKRVHTILLGLTVASYWLACSPKKFEKDLDVNKCQNFAEACISSNGRDYFDYTVKANGGLVDILFVSDNSGSMSFEQENMSQRFSSFLGQLDQNSVDYRIGVITTDVSSAATKSSADDGVSSSLYNEPRAINQNGALQDGNLIKLSNGELFLTTQSGSTYQKQELFDRVIKRPETKQCEEFLKSYPSSPPPGDGLRKNCPSGDERGIFAANLFFAKNSGSLIRPNAHLAIVFLADEDVRSSLYRNSTNVSFQLEEQDMPSSLISKVKSEYSGKTLSIHSIIVRPGDQACLTMQSRQMGPAVLQPAYGTTFNQVLGSEGFKYAEATSLTNGILGDICAKDYGNQLANIGSNIVDRLTDINLACNSPGDLSVSLNPQQDIQWVMNGSTLRFNQALNPGSEVNLKYSCPTL
jgi:hypothetical protein